MRPEPHDVVFFATAGELRDWFDANHLTAEELWLGGHRRASGRPGPTWSETVDEALCVGWIDSVRFSLGDDRYAQRFTPRRKGSNWSAVNVAKAAALIAAGRMRRAGLAAFEARTPERTGVYSYERPLSTLSEDEDRRFHADAAAWRDWERRPPSYRRAATAWVTGAKAAATRERRFAGLLEASRQGHTVRPLTRPADRPDEAPTAPRSRD